MTSWLYRWQKWGLRRWYTLPMEVLSKGWVQAQTILLHSLQEPEDLGSQQWRLQVYSQQWRPNTDRIYLQYSQAFPVFHPFVCVDTNTQKWKSGKKMEKSWEHSSHEWHRGGQGTTADKFKHVPVELSTTSRAWTVVKHSNLANWMMNWSKTYWISDVPRLLCVHLVSTRFAICDPLFPFTIHRVPYLSLIYLYIRGVGCTRDKLTFHSIASAQGYTRSMQKQYITNSSSAEFCWGVLGCSCSIDFLPP